MKVKALFSLPLPRPALPPCEAVTTREEPCWSGTTYTRSVCNLFYHAALDESTGEAVLAVTVFDVAGVAYLRLFATKAQYVTQVWENPDERSGHLQGDRTLLVEHLQERRSEATLDKLLWGFRYHSRQCCNAHALHPADAQTDAVLTEWLEKTRGQAARRGLTSSPLDAVAAWQKERLERALQERYDRIRREIDNRMLEIRPVPVDLKRWLDRAPLAHSRYFFYDYRKGRAQTGVCTHCQRAAAIEGARHRETVRCPHCRSDLTALANGRRTTRITDETAVAYLQTTKEGFVARTFRVWRTFLPESTRPKDSLHEEGRYFFRTGAGAAPTFAAGFVWGNFQNTGEYRFIAAYGKGDDTPRWVYPATLGQIRQTDPAYRYIDLVQIARRCGPVGWRALLENTVRFPGVEYLMRAGLHRLTRDVLHDGRGCGDVVDWSQKSLPRALDVERALLPELARLDAGADALRMLHAMGAKRNLETALWAARHKIAPHHMTHLLEAVAPRSIRQYLDQLFERAERYPVSWKNATETRQRHQLAGDWADYLQDCRLLGFDLTSGQVRYPQSLREAHQRTLALVKEQEDEVVAEGIRQAARRQAGLAFSNKALLIRPVASYAELVTEGQTLSHCVARYGEAVARGSSIILVIRQGSDPDTPFFTLELDPANLKIRQCRGRYNSSPGKEVEAFLKAWGRARLAKPAKQERVRVAA